MINVKTTLLKLWRYYVKYRVLRFSSYLCAQNIIVMVDISAIPVGEIGYPSDGIAVSAEKW